MKASTGYKIWFWLNAVMAFLNLFMVVVQLQLGLNPWFSTIICLNCLFWAYMNKRWEEEAKK